MRSPRAAQREESVATEGPQVRREAMKRVPFSHRGLNVQSETLSNVKVGDAEIHYIQRGAGEPTVLVHGTLGDYRVWGSLSDILAKRFRTISYSRRGYYPNQPVTQTMTIASHSADLSSLISQLSPAPVHLVGHSYGAYVATHYALHHPDMIKSLVISEPPIAPLMQDTETDLAELRRVEAETEGPVLDHYSAGRPEEAARVLLSYLEGNPRAYDSLPEVVKTMIRINSPAAYAEVKGGLEGITRDQLIRIRLPTLLMKSEFGPKALRRTIDILYELIPNASLKEIKGTSHGTITRSSDYHSAVTEFLARSQ